MRYKNRAIISVVYICEQLSILESICTDYSVIYLPGAAGVGNTRRLTDHNMKSRKQLSWKIVSRKATVVKTL
ncbi:hypothetical protein LSAT2_010013 [Lamellibrachia satsuma]|nr:hypothetical protein LSAT2_010013 [Lamellibrachia satsuma]